MFPHKYIPTRRSYSRSLKGSAPRTQFHKPIRPLLRGQWRPGMPCHWIEQTLQLQRKYVFVRLFYFIHLIAGYAYLRFRFNETIAVFTTQLWHTAYQYAFYTLEVISYISILFRILENWKTTCRNCVDLKQIPVDLIAPRLRRHADRSLDSHASRYPTIGVFVPCYNEDVDLVHDTLVATLNISYPRQLLSVYLCDDGKDDSKKAMVSYLKEKHSNIHYVTRPKHLHAKAGNLNYSLERTDCDLIVTLDADFIARPNLLQRLVPYYYDWNPAVGMYQFNTKLAAVQAPQHFRNLSPFDPDPTDQRATFFMEAILPGKDWFNATPLIGTTNLLNRAALKKAHFFPYHSVTEDTALSIILHSLGFQTYYVNESLASGLATTSLWSCFNQRERWLQGEWQILFSRKGPLSLRGLTMAQRILYLNMSWNRLVSIVHLLYDFASILLLVFSLTMVDVPKTWRFVQFLGPYIASGVLVRLVRTREDDGLGKSESGLAAFEGIFRFVVLKGLFTAIWRGRNIKFKVTDKTRVLGNKVDKMADPRARDWIRNVKRVWFNITMAFLLAFSICYSIINPPNFQLNGTTMSLTSDSALPVTLAVGFAAANLLPRLLAIYLCFTPLVSGWVMEDLVHGRCDQYAVDAITGKRYVPPSFISLIYISQLVCIFTSMTVLSVYALRESNHYGTFVSI